MPLRLSRTVAPPALAADDDDDDKVAAALATIKDAGIAGVASYFTVEVSFFAIALPIGYVVYHGTTGEWLQLQDLLSDGEGRVRLVGIILSYIRAAEDALPAAARRHLVLDAADEELPRRIGAHGARLASRFRGNLRMVAHTAVSIPSVLKRCPHTPPCSDPQMAQ